MKTRPQSWRDMSAAPRFFIAVVVLCGMTVLTYSVLHGRSQNPLKFFCYLVIALAASRLKVNLPGITGTMSVNFLFLLLGVLELSLSEAMALGCAAVVVQCFDRDRPIPIQVAFNVCSTALAIAVTFAAYRYSVFHRAVKNPSTLLFLAASVYFVANTLPVAAVISLTEKRSLRKIWSECYFWSFPYYLVGAGVAGMMSWLHGFTDWQTSLLTLPVVYLIYRSYRLYLGKLEDEKRHVEEMADLHMRTIEALALAIEAKDQTTHDHLQRVRVYAVEVARELKIDQEGMDALQAAALLHDIGKLAIPEHIVSKPGRLTPDEFEKMKIQHPIEGNPFVRLLGAHERDANGRLEDEVAALVAHAEHERRYAVHRADDRVSRERDSPCGPRELREHEPGGDGRHDEARDRFGDHDDICRRARGVHRPVSDCAHRLHAEAERVEERIPTGIGDSAGQAEGGRERGVERQIDDDDSDQRGRPPSAQEEMVHVAKRRTRRTHDLDLRGGGSSYFGHRAPF